MTHDRPEDFWPLPSIAPPEVRDVTAFSGFGEEELDHDIVDLDRAFVLEPFPDDLVVPSDERVEQRLVGIEQQEVDVCVRTRRTYPVQFFGPPAHHQRVNPGIVKFADDASDKRKIVSHHDILASHVHLATHRNQGARQRFSGLRSEEPLDVRNATMRENSSSTTIRVVESREELRAALDAVGGFFTPPFDHTDIRLARLPAQFDAEPRLMVVAVNHDGVIVGGAFAHGTRGDAGTLTTIAVSPAERRTGIGRALITVIESTCTELGVTGIYLGAKDDARPFYRALGYTGRSRMFKPMPASITARYGGADERQARLEALRARKAARSTP